MTGIPLCEEESENYSLLNRKQGGQPTQTHMHKSRDTQAAALSPICTQEHTCIHTSVCPGVQEYVHRHANRNTVHKQHIHPHLYIKRAIAYYVLLYIHIQRALPANATNA